MVGADRDRSAGGTRQPPDGACRECAGRRFAFVSARCAATLEPPISSAIVLLKDGGERRYARLLAGLLAECTRSWLTDDDVLVPIPASPAALRRRGFDHSCDIARTLGRLTELPVKASLVSAGSADQRSLGRDARFLNRSGAFRLRPGTRVPECVVLIDDVLTTGATMHAAALTLQTAGVLRVRALAVARSSGGSSPCPPGATLGPGT